ncbi:MAG: acyl carrier protein [Alcanivorax sp.]|nr:acyl carrier protein [Alcanivorax sp.]
MNQQAMRAAVIEELTRIAPDIDPAGVDDNVSLRDEYDLDSMDSLNLAAALHQRLGIAIPEADFARLQTLGDLLAYLGD